MPPLWELYTLQVTIYSVLQSAQVFLGHPVVFSLPDFQLYFYRWERLVLY